MPLGLSSKRVLLPGMLEKTPAHINPCFLCPRERPSFWVRPEGRWWVAKDVWKEVVQWGETAWSGDYLFCLLYFWRAFWVRKWLSGQWSIIYGKSNYFPQGPEESHCSRGNREQGTWQPGNTAGFSFPHVFSVYHQQQYWVLRTEN